MPATRQSVSAAKLTMPTARSEYRELYTRKPVQHMPLSQRHYRTPHDGELLGAHARAIPNANTHPTRVSKTSVSLMSLMALPHTPNPQEKQCRSMSASARTGRSLATASGHCQQAQPMQRRQHPTQYMRSASTVHHQQAPHPEGCSRHMDRLQSRETASSFLRVRSQSAAASPRSRASAQTSGVTNRNTSGGIVVPHSARTPARSQRSNATRHMDPDQMLAVLDDLRQSVLEQKHEQTMAAQKAVRRKRTATTAQQLMESIDRMDSAVHQQTTARVAKGTTKRGRAKKTKQLAAAPGGDALGLEEGYWRHSQAVLEDLDRQLQSGH